MSNSFEAVKAALESSSSVGSDPQQPSQLTSPDVRHMSRPIWGTAGVNTRRAALIAPEGSSTERDPVVDEWVGGDC